MKNYEEFRNQAIDEYQSKSLIIDALNYFGSITLENYSPLIITRADFDILFDLTLETLECIKDSIEFGGDELIFGNFVVFAFKALFIGENDLKLDNLFQKLDYFSLILEYTVEEKINVLLINIFVNDLRNNLGEMNLESILFQNIFTNDIIYFIYLLLRKHNCPNSELNEFIMKVLENLGKANIHFSYDKLKKIPHKEIIKDLYQIFFVDKIKNKFHLFLHKAHLKAVEFTRLELMDDEELSDSTCNMEKIEEKNVIQKEEDFKIEEDKKDEIKPLKQSNDSSKIKKDSEEIDINNITDNAQFLNMLLKRVQNLEKYREENEKYKAENEKYKDENEKYKKDNEKYKRENEKYKKDNEKYKKDNEKRMEEFNRKEEKQNREINSLRQKISEDDREIARLNFDLALIKLRDAFKYFVKCLYIGLDLNGDFEYEDMINQLIGLFNSKTFNSPKYNITLVMSTKNFLNELIGKVASGNYNAHHFDLCISVLEQIFSFIDKKKEHLDLLVKLKGTNADETITEFCKNKILNFYNKSTLKDKEKQIILSVQKLRRLWIKN